MSRTQIKTDGQSELAGVDTNTDLISAVSEFSKKWEGKKKVLIAAPTMGVINYQAHEAMCDLIANTTRYEYESDYKFFKSCIGRLMVAYSRERFCEFAVDFNFDYIFFVDDDHYYPPDIFRKLEKYLNDYDIVAPMCVQRVSPYYPVIYKTEMKKLDDGKIYMNNQKYADMYPLKKGDIVTDADAIGFGCAVIKVELLKRMDVAGLKPWFFSMSPVGEDILFCMKAKEVGAKIVIDTNVEAPHLREPEFADWRDYEREKIKRDNAKLRESENAEGIDTDTAK